MSSAVEAALYARLAGDATLAGLAPGGVWRDNAPLGTTGVIVTFTFVSGIDQYTLADRALTRFNYLVKAITPGESAVPAWNAANRVEALLTDQPLPISTGSVMSVRRDSIISMTETDGGETYQHAGAYYIIFTQEH